MRKSQGSTLKPESKPAAKDTEIVASGDTGVHSGLVKTNGWIKDYLPHPFDPNLDWRDPPPTEDFGGRPIPASIRHSMRRSTEMQIRGTMSWNLNPWYDLSSRIPSDAEIARFERAKDAAMFNDFSSAYRWGTLLGAVPALLFVCGCLFGGLTAAMWTVLGGYLIMSLVASLAVLPKLTQRWLQTDTARSIYNRNAEPFISMFYYGFAIVGATLIGFPLMLVTAFIMR